MIQLVVLSIMARLVAPESFGLLATALAFLQFAQVFAEGGVSAALVQREELLARHCHTAFWMSIVLGLALASLMYASAGVIAAAYGFPGLESVMEALSVSLILSSAGAAPLALLRRQMRFRAIAVRGLLAQLAGGVLGVFLAVRGADVWSLVVMYISARVVELALTWALSDFRPAVRADRTSFLQLFGFGLNVLASRVVLFVNERSPQFLIPALLGSKAAGYYFLAYRIIDVLVLLMVRPATIVAFTAFARLQHDRDRMVHMFLRALEFTAAAATPVFVVVALVAHDLVPLLWGERWAVAAWIIVVLIPFGVFRSLVLLTQQAILAVGRPGWNLTVNLVSTAMVVALIVSVSGFGIVAVAAAMNVQLFLVVPMSLWFLAKAISVPAQDCLKALVPSIGSAAIMAMVVFGCQSLLIDTHYRAIDIAIAALLGTIVYLAVFRVWAPNTVTDISNVLRELVGPRKGNGESEV